MRVDHERPAGWHPALIIPAFHHCLLDQNNDVGFLVFVSELVLQHHFAHAAVLARWGVGAIGIVHIVFHGLSKLAFEPSGSSDGIDDVAALFIHDDAPRPYCEFRVAHDPLSSCCNRQHSWRVARPDGPLAGSEMLRCFFEIPQRKSWTGHPANCQSGAPLASSSVLKGITPGTSHLVHISSTLLWK